MILVKPVPKLGNRIWLPPVAINETGGALRFLLPDVPMSIFGTMNGPFIFVTTGGSLPDC